MASESVKIGGLRAGDDAAARIDPIERQDRPARATVGRRGMRLSPEIAGHAPQRHVLLRLLAAAIDGFPRPEPWLDEQLDWDSLIVTAAAGRVLAHVYHGAMICGIDVPPSLRAAARTFRGRSLLVNSVNLSTIQRVSAALDRDGLAFVVIKGPLQLHALYADYFVRPSSDIDLLVAREDYDRAARVLGTLGYQPAERCRSRWWTHYLGEQHFMADDKALATVDLHHRIQQPGCPAPHELQSYIDEARRVALGHAAVPVLSTVHACLLTAVSFVKAVYHREHSMRYLCDMAVMLRAMSEADCISLRQTADAQGLRNQLIFAWRCAVDLLPVALPPIPPRKESSPIAPEMMAEMILSPDSTGIDWPKRRELLWHLCDPRGALGRVGPYAREASFAAAAELSRLRAS